MTDTKTARSIELSTEIAAPPEAVLAALTQADLIARWFPPIAEAKGDVVVFSWGEDMKWESRVVEVKKGQHIRWGDGPDDPIVTDWHIETKGGNTVVRLVQSVGTGPEWDDAYDAYETGWRYFLFNLRHYLTHHRGVPRLMAWKRHPTQLARPVLWERVTGGLGDVMRRAVIQETKPLRGLWATLPDLNDSVVFVELEGKTLGVYVSTYGLPAERVRELQGWVDSLSHLAT
jgi:uncharacterized protein YndB with AHSA1/START domain